MYTYLHTRAHVRTHTQHTHTHIDTHTHTHAYLCDTGDHADEDMKLYAGEDRKVRSECALQFHVLAPY